jgi:4-aminobutyrate aminotransferase/diaminobutyrate-pyruvate transaminase/4-aminobutyrate aminotransferase/(S)-3-amino-2-methylpropionate transaminase
MGSQLAGGIPGLKEWIGYRDEHFANVPFPDGGVRSPAQASDFAYFETCLKQQGVKPEQVCGVMTETYQGGNSSFAPPLYMQQLRQWCDRHGAVLVMDEVQAGFGRTGTFWGFEHYGIVPDLIACGKGISGSLPLSAVIGRRELLDMFPPGSMTSTHSGNPVCSAAALASLKLILKEKLAERSARLAPVLQDGCARIRSRFSDVILAHHGKGLVASLHCVKPGTREADGNPAWRVVGRAVQSGVMLFAPVGFGGASVKLSPPLVIEEDALAEGLRVVEEAFASVLETAAAR